MDVDQAAILAKERENHRARLNHALTEDTDPLAAYLNFVKWTLEAYKGHLSQSGLLELLDEATRYFLNDDAYKADLRYLRLWLLYAKHVEDPTVIYAFVLNREIGKIYAQIYQDYALALHSRGKWDEAERVFQKGIRRHARPTESLKRAYEEFKARTLAPPRKPPPETVWADAPPETQALRRNPLKNHPPASSSSSRPPQSASSSAASSSKQASSSRQTSMRPPSTQPQRNPSGTTSAPSAAGKRQEKLRFNLSLLVTEDGQEFCMQEARARSMGLLGKKWGPPPEAARPRVSFASAGADASVDESPDVSADASADVTADVSADDVEVDSTKTLSRRFAAGAEPTVTLATKEALADVFGMFNSPEKSTRYGMIPGSKHAPVRRIEPVTPMPVLPLARALSNENANAGMASKTPGQSFRPFVDENARRENQTPAPKILPFVDPENAAKPAITPNPNRPVLSLKDSTSTAPAKQDENARSLKKLVIHKDTDESKPPPVFTLTPASATFQRPQGRWDIFTDDAAKTGNENILRPASAGAPRFMPFSDENAPKVFSRPVPKSENNPAPTFTPFVEKTLPKPVPSSSASARPVLGERTPLHTVFVPPPTKPEPAPGDVSVDEGEENQRTVRPETPTTESESDASARERFLLEQQQSQDPMTSESSSEADDYDQYEGDSYEQHPADAPVPIEGDSGEDSMYDDYDDEGDRQQAPFGGRFGQFDVMTPITERTAEYTMSTRGGTPGGLVVHRDAVEAAVQLAAELQEDRDDEDEDEGEVDGIEERTGTLSLVDALGVASSFKPPNPCNPFDPPIVSTLLRLIPLDSGFHDLRASESQQLDALQKFAKKKTRRASGNSSSSRAVQDADTVEVQLQDRHFAVVDKLGEGGFGAVFEAIDLDMQRKNAESDDDEDEDDEDEDKNRVALKVVKPRNLWEFHVLRRIHNTLPARLRRSVITPQALYAFKDESFLVLELCKQGTLLDIVNRAPAAGISQQGACLDELLVMFFSIELLRLLEGLHRAGFIHGDVKIDNCLLRLEDVPGPASAWESVYQPSGAGGWAHKGIKLIDFGRTVDTRLFPIGQRYVAEWPTDARDCFEAREGRPWTFQTDYYGLAGIIYCLLYGKYIEAASVVPAPASAEDGDGPVRYKLATPFKRYWQGELWTRLFDLLLNPTLVRPDGKLPVSDELAALRGEMEVWLQANCNRASNSLKGLLKKVGLAILGGKDAR